MTDQGIQDDVVLIRTSAGQDAVFDDQELDTAQRRLLRLLNGYTSLSDLMARLDRRHDWRAAAAALLARHLVSARPAASDASAQAGLTPVAGNSAVNQVT